MRGTKVVWMLTVAGVVGMAASAARSRPQAAPPPACAVAFVNLGKVFQGYPAARKLVDGLQAEHDALKSSVAIRAKELSDAARDLEAQFEPGSPEFQKGRKKIEMAGRELEWDEQNGREEIKAKQVRGMARVYREVVAEAERIAGERGFTAVLNFDREPIQVEEKPGQLISYTDLKLQMALRTALWVDPSVDLTEAVIEALNK